jgi:hypothetical protein
MPNWQKVGQHYAKKYDIPWQLFNAMINQESGWNPKAASPAGAIGLGQLMPGTAQGLGVNPYNPRQNLKGSAMYLANQYNTFGKWGKALAAYNAGPGAVTSGDWKGYPETRNYVSSIMGAYGGPGQTGPGNAFDPTGRGSFVGIDPKSIDEAHRKQAALSLIASAYPESGLDPVLAAAYGKKIGENVRLKKYGFNYGMPGGNMQNFDNAKLMRAIVALAERRGLTVGENPAYGGVNPVHTEGSFHYQTFGKHPNLGRAVDINYYGPQGSPDTAQAAENAQLLNFFRLIRHRFGLQNINELLLPGRTYFQGGDVSRSTYPGHYNHLHLAI